jgi:hypothetical protein
MSVLRCFCSFSQGALAFIGLPRRVFSLSFIVELSGSVAFVSLYI